MAALIPDIPVNCPNSERLVYGRLGRELPDDWVVLHSLGLPGHETKLWGEADLVVVMNSDGKRGYVEKLGSLDDCRQEIIDLLEGGEEAFNLRRERYAKQ